MITETSADLLDGAEVPVAAELKAQVRAHLHELVDLPVVPDAVLDKHDREVRVGAAERVHLISVEGVHRRPAVADVKEQWDPVMLELRIIWGTFFLIINLKKR